MRLTKIVGVIAIVMAMLLLTSCATQKNYQMAVDSWQGATSTQLIRTWGYPKQIKRMPSGNKLYVYRTRIHGRNPVVSTPGEREVVVKHGKTRIRETDPTVSGGGTFDLRCKTWFEINKRGRVVAANFRGNNCVATDAQRQQLSD